MERTIIEQVFIRNFVIASLLLCGCIGVFFLIRWAVKEELFSKWSYVIYFLVSFAIIIIVFINLMNIYIDINKKDYVIYEGYYEERGGSQSHLKTVIIYNNDGEEIRLLRTGVNKKGEYRGVIVYGKRSNVIVEYSEKQYG